MALPSIIVPKPFKDPFGFITHQDITAADSLRKWTKVDPHQHLNGLPTGPFFSDDAGDDNHCFTAPAEHYARSVYLPENGYCIHFILMDRNIIPFVPWFQVPIGTVRYCCCCTVCLWVIICCIVGNFLAADDDDDGAGTDEVRPWQESRNLLRLLAPFVELWLLFWSCLDCCCEWIESNTFARYHSRQVPFAALHLTFLGEKGAFWAPEAWKTEVFQHRFSSKLRLLSINLVLHAEKLALFQLEYDTR